MWLCGQQILQGQQLSAECQQKCYAAQQSAGFYGHSRALNMEALKGLLTKLL